MGTRVESFAATIPAGTTKASPVTVPLAFPPGYLEHVDVVIPDGVSGLAGFQLAYGGQPLIPETPGAWIVGNDEKFPADPDFAMVGQQWQLIGYNSDINDHTFQVRCYVREIAEETQTAGGPASVLPLSIVPDATVDTGTVDLTPLPTDTGPAPTDQQVPDVTGDAPTLDPTLGDAPPPDDTAEVAPAPIVDTTLGDAPTASDA